MTSLFNVLIRIIKLSASRVEPRKIKTKAQLFHWLVLSCNLIILKAILGDLCVSKHNKCVIQKLENLKIILKIHQSRKQKSKYQRKILEFTVQACVISTIILQACSLYTSVSYCRTRTIFEKYNKRPFIIHQLKHRHFLFDSQ